MIEMKHILEINRVSDFTGLLKIDDETKISLRKLLVDEKAKKIEGLRDIGGTTSKPY